MLQITFLPCPLKSHYRYRVVIISLYLITLCQQSLAQHYTPSLLWEVTNKGNKDTAYLFGTFHEVNPAFFTAYPRASELLTKADILVLETKIAGNTADKRALKLNYNRAKWEHLLGNAQTTTFDRFTTKAEDSSYYSMPPLVAALTLNRMYLKNYCDTAGEMTTILMDEFIEQKALESKKTVVALEENQMKTLSDITTSNNNVQEKKYAITTVTLMEKMLTDNADLCDDIYQYRRRQLDYRLNQPSPGDADLLHNRNKLWIAQLDHLFKKGRCFVAVGFRHLYYRDGLIASLQKMGYYVRPVISQ